MSDPALLDGPGPDRSRVGALTLPRTQVVAFRTDAIYTTEAPGWADDGKPGRYRLKGSITLTANYAKKTASTVSAPAAVKPAFGAKPVTALPAKKPAGPPGPAQAARRAPVGPPGAGPNRPLGPGSKNDKHPQTPTGAKPLPGRKNPDKNNAP